MIGSRGVRTSSGRADDIARIEVFLRRPQTASDRASTPVAETSFLTEACLQPQTLRRVLVALGAGKQFR
jgi:hypothetical protein